MLISPVQALVLDAVGTVIEPTEPIARTYTAAAARQGIQIPTDLVRQRFVTSLEKTTCADSSGRFPTAESAERDRWFAIVAEVLAEIPDTRRAFEELWAHFESPKAWRVFNDVHPLLQCADRHGIPIAIGSNFDQRLRGVLAGHDATAALENLVISSEVGWRKPDPDFYRRAEIAIGFPARHVAWIGDSLTHDYHAPRDAGFQAILLDRGRTQHFTHAISSLTAIVDWIESNRNSA